MATKVGEISVTNFKKIKSLDVQANGGNVFILGKNGTGKSTLIQALYCLLTGKELPPDPITIGEHKGEISVKLFNDMTKETVCVAKLVFTEKNPKGKLTVTTEDGRDVPGGPRTFLDKLTENLLFDPFDFIRMTDKAQVKFLKELIGVNFDALDKEHKEIWDKRADVNRDIKNLKGANETADIKEHELTLFKTKKDLAELQAKMKSAEQTNEKLRQAKFAFDTSASNIARYGEAIETLKQQKIGLEETVSAYEKMEHFLSILLAKSRVVGVQNVNCMKVIDAISMAQTGIAGIKTDIVTINGRIEQGEKEKAAEEQIFNEHKVFLESAKEVSVTDMNEQFQQAVAFNQKCDKVKEYSDRLLLIEEKEALSKSYTERLNEIHNERLSMIATKGIPAGLSIDFEKECLTYEGLAFDETQMSKSKIIAIGIELMMSTNPQLRICRIKDGSLLDTDTMNELIGIINEQDFQAFVELVSPEKEGLEISIQEV
jgi:DNA repair exonuclease SbcCD ATPase subunit